MKPLSVQPTASAPLLSPAEATAEVRRVTWVGLWLNVVLSAVKFVAGVVGQSAALVADAVHSMSDLVTDVAVLVGSRYWSQPPDEDHPYGHRRIETMVTIVVGLVLGLVGLGLTYEAVTALRLGERHVPALATSVVALLSVVSKEWLYRWTVAAGTRLKSTAVIANAWHHRSDAISSIPVLFAILAARVLPDWWFLDHVGAAVVSGFIIKAAIDIVRPGVAELMDRGASVADAEELQRIAAATDGVLGIHDLRTRLVGSAICADLHVVVGERITVLEGHRIGEQVAERLKQLGPNVVDVVVHLDPYDDRPEAERDSKLAPSLPPPTPEA
jgi:cation diffusion facilitator family transporter